MGYSIYSTGDPFHIPEEVPADYFKATVPEEPKGNWDYSSREAPSDPIPPPTPVPSGNWDYSSRETPNDPIPPPIPVQKTPPKAYRPTRRAQKAPPVPRPTSVRRSPPKTSKPTQRAPSPPKPPKQVKARGNWDHSARELPTDPIPPRTLMRRGRKKNAEWVDDDPNEGK
ncbi:hypothetical protein MMC07_009182 [Pseudocyphellaria aurata]|nr:hypothetical protein [Pseudocyphellaria aurata]